VSDERGATGSRNIDEDEECRVMSAVYQKDGIMSTNKAQDHLWACREL
jgi:hypothetical protein